MSYRSKTLIFLSILLAATPVLAESPRETMNVWPGQPPGDEGRTFEPESILPDQPGRRKVKRLTNVIIPTITVYKPANESANGTAIVICPGGGYNILGDGLRRNGSRRMAQFYWRDSLCVEISCPPSRGIAETPRPASRRTAGHQFGPCQSRELERRHGPSRRPRFFRRRKSFSLGSDKLAAADLSRNRPN